MTLQPGCRFAVAPRFHLAADWPRRLRIGTGVQEAGGGFVPCGPWRAPHEDELQALLPAPDAAPEELADCVRLFPLPRHLFSAWWDLLDAGAGQEGALPGFDVFVGRLAEFFAFKGLPMPDGARCEVIVSKPGQRSVRPRGLACSLAASAPWPVAEGVRPPGLWGGINLGDEESSLVLVNLSCRRMEAELRRRCPEEDAPQTISALAELFLRRCGDYPPVRVTLGPGEGYHLPECGVIVDGSTEGKEEADVLLRISTPY